jgi:hypothetical protein
MGPLERRLSHRAQLDMNREVRIGVEAVGRSFALGADRKRGGPTVAFDRCQDRRTTAVLWATLAVDGSRPRLYHAA